MAVDRLRFDVSHQKAITADELAAVEADVNARIRNNNAVTTRLMTPDAAVAAGAMALFGEKYGDEVRVVSMGADHATSHGNYSVELCGGTHVSATGDIALFKIISESAVSSGVRRIEALSGEAARLWFVEQENALKHAAQLLKTAPADVPERIAALVEERRMLERALADAKKALALGGGSTAAANTDETINGISFRAQVLDGLNPKDLRSLVDDAKAALGSGIVVIIATNDGKAAVSVGVTDDLTSQYSAVDLCKAAVAALGGQGGGGRPDMAQGGGPNAADATKALDAVRVAIRAAV